MPGKIHPLGHELLASRGEQVRELEPVPPDPAHLLRRVKARKITTTPIASKHCTGRMVGNFHHSIHKRPMERLCSLTSTPFNRARGMVRGAAYGLLLLWMIGFTAMLIDTAWGYPIRLVVGLSIGAALVVAVVIGDVLLYKQRTKEER